MMYLFCNICNKETKHSHGDVQSLPRGNVDLYNCSRCGGTQSVAQSSYADLGNGYDTGWSTPVTNNGTRAQSRETVVEKPKRRGLFG